VSRRCRTVPVAQLEFHEGGNTLWVHGPDGGTVLRIKTMGRIVVDNNCASPTPHGDIIVNSDIHLCINAPKRRAKKPVVTARPDGTIDGVFDAGHVAAAFGATLRRTRRGKEKRK